MIKSAILTGSIADAARENHVSDSTAWRIARKYQQQLHCHAAVGGHFQKEVMKDFVQLYIELLVVVDPTIYLTEIQERLASDLGLQNDEVPSTAATISRFLLSQSIMRKKCKKVALERFTPENIARRRAFIQWRSSVDPREIFVVDETGIEDFHRNFGRNHSGIPVPQLTPKTPGQTWSVLGVVRFHGVVHAIPFDGNYTFEMFEHAIRHKVLPSLPCDSYVMMDNASIHNDNRLANILQAKNITLVKLPHIRMICHQ